MPEFRVFATCDIGSEALDRLRQQGYRVEVYEATEPPPKSLILEKLREGVEALVTTLRDPIDREVFEAGRGTLKVVSQDAVGFDNIDLEAAGSFGVPVCHTAEVLTHATAEFALFMLGCVARKLYPSERLVREQEWRTWHPYRPFLGDEVTGKCVAVIGMGRIGQAFASKASGLDLDFLLVDPVSPPEQFAARLRRLLDLRAEMGLARRPCQVRVADLAQGLREADFVSLHVPLTPQTHHLIDRTVLRQMKESAFLINSSRGPVVDEAALSEALREGWIAGAALDVYEKEPLPADSPLRDPKLEDRVRIFHHFASATRETRLSPDPEVGMAGRCVQGVIDVLEGRYQGDPSRMPYVVNKQAFGTPS